VGLSSFAERTGLPVSRITAAAARAQAAGLLDDEPSWLRPTVRGQRFLNDLVALFLADRADAA
jgi:oxygen-independent coproporphyrinogen-3 oxidase